MSLRTEEMINSVLFAANESETSRRLEAAIRSIDSTCFSGTLRTLEAFGSWLCRHFNQPPIAVLLAETFEELQQLAAIEHWLHLADVRVLLILPNASPQTVMFGWRLLPRYIGYVGGDFSEVSEVMAKMSNCRKTSAMQNVAAKDTARHSRN
jgi:hypothetical protein